MPDYCGSEIEDRSATNIQQAYRCHLARLRLKKQAAWKIHEKLEYADEQTEAKLLSIFDRLLKDPNLLSNSVAKSLENARLPVEEETLLRSTNPADIPVEDNYWGPRIDGPITRKTLVTLIEAFQRGEVLHERYVCEIVHQARAVLKKLPNFNHIDLSHLQHIYIIGDLHGQLADLLHIFNANGLPGLDNPYIFNGDFVDRGRNSVEVLLLLLTALVLSPSSVFLNRGNHEDIMVTVRYGFQKEVNQKYPRARTPLIDLFKDLFSWLPIYSYVNTGKTKILIVHGGISDRIDLNKMNNIARNRYISLEVRPQSKSGGKRLTPEEDDEYRQMQDLLWSDPDPQGHSGCRKNDERNIGSFFGKDITTQFLKKYNLSLIIRSHQVVREGYEFKHDEKLLTVFSASNYSNGSNYGAIVRWGYNEEKGMLIAHKIKADDVDGLSFSKEVTLFEDPVYFSLIENIMRHKGKLLKEFRNADEDQTDHISRVDWSHIMTTILQLDLPWLTFRAKLVQEDEQGILYNTMFQDYSLDTSKFQPTSVGIIEDLYQWKDVLIFLFNLIDRNHSGFISRQEFADAMQIVMSYDNNVTDVDNAYIEKLASAMDFDHNGKIDINEFLESFRIVSMGNSEK